MAYSSMILRRPIYPAASAAARCCCNWICARPISTEAVSSSSSSSPAAPAPWLMIEDGGLEDGLYSGMAYNFYSLADNQVTSMDKKRGKHGMVVGSSHGWLALMKWRHDYYKWRRVKEQYSFDMFLYNPLSHRLVNLPPLETLPIPRDKFIRGWGLPSKVILTCSPDPDNQREGDTCRAILCFGKQYRLAQCTPGRSNEWTPMGLHYHENEPINRYLIRKGWSLPPSEIDEEHGINADKIPRMYEDFVYSSSKKRLFCVTTLRDYECWDLLSHTTTPILEWKLHPRIDFLYDKKNFPVLARSKQEYDDKTDFCMQHKYLVFAERSSRLFIVHRYVKFRRASGSDVKSYDYNFPYETLYFDVYEIIVGDRGNKKGEMRYMDGTLDGMTFFIGHTSHGFVVEHDEEETTTNSNNNKNGVERNCIYFTDQKELTPYPWDTETDHGGHDLGIFNYENGTFSPCYYSRDMERVKRLYPTPNWFTPSPP